MQNNIDNVNLTDDKDLYITKLKSSLESRDKKISELELKLEIIKNSKQVGFDEDKKIWKYNMYLMSVLKDAIKSSKKAEEDANKIIKEMFNLKKDWMKEIDVKINKPIDKIVKENNKKFK